MFFPRWLYVEKLVSRLFPQDRRVARQRKRSCLGIEQLERRILLNADNQLFVNTLYQDLLHRGAEPSGLAFWTGALERGVSRQQVAFSMTSGTEYRTDEVQSLYRDLLKRSADTEGFTYFLGRLNSGATDEQAKAEMIGSTEYFQTRAGQSDAGFVTAVYEDIFLRAPDSAGQAFVTGQLGRGTSRTVVATEVLTSSEYRHNVAEDFYEQFLFRTGETAGLEFWSTHLQRGDTTEQVLAGFPGEPEYSTQIEHRQPLSGRPPLAVPESTGQTVATTFTLTGGANGTPDELGLFAVDAQGRIGALNPLDPGYAEAALSNPSSQILFAQGQTPGAVQTVNLPAGSFMAFYLVQQNSTHRQLLHDPADQLGLKPMVYFSLPQANPDLFDHVQLLPNNQFAFEDQTGGGDRDFNDEVVQITFATAEGGDVAPPVIEGGDVTPPVIQAALTHDTGSSAVDGVTFDPALAFGTGRPTRQA